MEELSTLAFDVTKQQANQSVRTDVTILATSHIMYKIGKGLSDTYFAVLIPVGIVGNILSFLVMTQKHNRNISFSLYISMLSVTDSIVLIVGLTRYLNMVFGVDMPPNQQGHCSIIAFGLFFGSMSSTFFITNMTFERFYSILVPHKAASFNTVKRAKITIACILVFSLLFNFPHFFISSNTGRVCNSFGKAIRSKYGQVYYWFFFCLNFTVPFASLLTMNVFIIYTLKSRSMTFLGGSSNQGHSQGQTMRNSERQITITLLLVTFVFLILSIPGLVMVFYTNYIDVRRSKYTFAGYYLFYNVAQKAVYTNHGINFFLYVISGKKFRVDLINLFSCSENSGVDMTMGSDINPKIKAFSVKKQEHLSGQVRRKTEE